METSQHGSEELKRLVWSLYTPEETRSFQSKVNINVLYQD
jgi:hypothetical protein